MKFYLVVEERKHEGRTFKTQKIVCENANGSVLLTYDERIICNVLDCSPARLRSFDIGKIEL